MNIIILGANEIGISLTQTLQCQADYNITLIDLNEHALQKAQETLDIQIIQGNGASPRILKLANAQEADALIAVTNKDEINLLACQIAHQCFQIKTKIARIYSDEYLSSQNSHSLEQMPVDTFIHPERIITQHIETLIRYPGFSQIQYLCNEQVNLVSLEPHNTTPFYKKKSVL